MQKSLHIKIKEQSIVAKVAAWKLKAKFGMAITIGNTIYLYRCSEADFLKEKRWVLHEVQHVLQFKKYGLITFLIKYIWSVIQSGYYLSKYEIEARKAEHNNHILNTYKLFFNNKLAFLN